MLCFNNQGSGSGRGSENCESQSFCSDVEAELRTFLEGGSRRENTSPIFSKLLFGKSEIAS